MRPPHLRMARAGLGWTLKDLAEQAGVNLNTISRYEAGKEVLTGTVDRIEKVLAAQGIVFLYEDTDHGPGIRLPPGSASNSADQPKNKPEKARLKKRSQRTS
jgi:transcriptional regulator with XRE-family HTH domain